MEEKTINAIICKKFDEWVETIKNPEVKALVQKNTVATGGCIASMLLDEPVNDFDFYFTDFETTKAVADYYVSEFNAVAKVKFKGTDDSTPITVQIEPGDLSAIPPVPDRVKVVVKSAGIANEDGTDNYQYFESSEGQNPGNPETEQFVDTVMDVHNDKQEKPPYRPVFLSTNAITLAGNVQLVIRFYGTPEEIHENYDYVHATNFWTSADRKVVTNFEACKSLLHKKLKYIGSKYPICSLLRARKFLTRYIHDKEGKYVGKKPWTINAGQILKISMQIHDLDLNNVKVLEEQLVGMDVAYFNQVLAYLKEKNVERVDRAYLMEIIDRMF